jgi:Na+-translocating ferredoxin:NAD+ oxidoreductase RnfG subunit
MLTNLKQTSLLLLIAILSGLIIWGTYELTSDIRFENAEKERLSVYLDIFEEADVTKLTFESIDAGTLSEQVTVYNNSDELLGYVLRGQDTNALGDIEVLIGINANNEIVAINIVDTDNTADYIKNLENNYLPNLINSGITTVSYDTNTGATISYGSIQKMIEDSRLVVAGDPQLTAYQSLLPDVTDYELNHAFNLGMVAEEQLLYANESMVAYGYTGSIVIGEDTVKIAVVIDTDGIFKGIVPLSEVSDSVHSIIDSYDTFIDQVVTDIEGTLTEDLDAFFNLSVSRYLEDDALRSLRAFFLDAASASDVETIDDDILNSRQLIYDNSDALLGVVFETESRGYALPADYDDPYIRLNVVLDTEGQVASIVVISHHETEGISSAVFDNIDALYGINDIDNFDADVFAGATYTASGVLDAVDAAQTYYEGMGE